MGSRGPRGSIRPRGSGDRRFVYVRVPPAAGIASASVPARCRSALAEWDIHFGIAAGFGGVHAGGYPSDVALYEPPLGISEYHYRNCATFQILLRHHVLVGREQDLEARFFGDFQQLAVYQLVPPGVFRFGDGVALKERNERCGRTVIKQNAHW